METPEARPRTHPRSVSVLLSILLTSGATMLLVQALWVFAGHPSTPELEVHFFGFELLELAISSVVFASVLAAVLLLWRSRPAALWAILATIVFAGASIGQRLVARDLHGLVYSFGLVGIIVLVFW